MSPVKRPPPKVKDDDFKRFLDTKKLDTVVLGPIQRHLLQKRSLDPNDGRPQDVLHPSEMSKDDWCTRAEYFKLSGAPRLKEEKVPSYVMETIFAEGHTAHDKYQNWLWDLGMLQGNFSCEYCGFRWWDESPQECKRPGCVAGRECLVYREVPVRSEEYLIAGHADGELIGGRDGIEVKTIGIGTVRAEHPELLATHTHEMPDGSKQVAIDDLWSNINRPFPSHFRQGQIYGVIRGWERVIYIYECKWNQRTKEFIIKVNPKLIKNILEGCKDVKYALEKGRPPRCTYSGEGNCTHCSVYESENSDGRTKNNTEGDHSSGGVTEARLPPRRRPHSGGGDRERPGQGRPRQAGPAPAGAPRIRRTVPPRRSA